MYSVWSDWYNHETSRIDESGLGKYGKKLHFDMSMLVDNVRGKELKVFFQLFYFGENVQPELFAEKNMKDMWFRVYAEGRRVCTSKSAGPHKHSLCWLIPDDGYAMLGSMDALDSMIDFMSFLHVYEKDEEYGWPYIFAIQWNKSIINCREKYREYLLSEGIHEANNGYLDGVNVYLFGKDPIEYFGW